MTKQQDDLESVDVDSVIHESGKIKLRHANAPNNGQTALNWLETTLDYNVKYLTRFKKTFLEEFEESVMGFASRNYGYEENRSVGMG